MKIILVYTDNPLLRKKYEDRNGFFRLNRVDEILFSLFIDKKPNKIYIEDELSEFGYTEEEYVQLEPIRDLMYGVNFYMPPYRTQHKIILDDIQKAKLKEFIEKWNDLGLVKLSAPYHYFTLHNKKIHAEFLNFPNNKQKEIILTILIFKELPNIIDMQIPKDIMNVIVGFVATRNK